MAGVPKEFQQAFRTLVIAFQPRGLERDTVQVYYASLQIYPLDVLCKTADGLTRSQTFFPTTGEWAQAAAAEQKDAQRALLNGPADLGQVECKHCDDTGSVFAECRGDATCGRANTHLAHAFVCVCACRPTNRSYQRRLAAQTILGTSS